MATKRDLYVGDNVTSKGDIKSEGELIVQSDTTQKFAVKTLDPGTASERAVVNVDNGTWIVSPAYVAGGGDANGYVNVMKVNQNNEVIFGTTINTLENIQLPDNPGTNLPFVDCFVDSSALVGEVHSYAMRMNFSPIISMIGVADGVGGLSDKSILIDGSIENTGNKPITLKTGNVEGLGDWRFINNAGILEIQKYNGIEWVVAQSVSVVDSPPLALDVNITGVPESGSYLYGTYTYYDINEDPEGSSILQWYEADDENGLNEAAIVGLTTGTILVPTAQEGKYLCYGVTPVASTGTLTGVEVKSDYTTIVLDSAGPAIDSVSLGALNAYLDITMTEGVWGDASQATVVDTADYDTYFTKSTGTGTATAITEVDITQTNGSPLVGGETDVRMNITFDGTIGGDGEYVRIRTRDTIYDALGNSAGYVYYTPNIVLVAS